MSDNIPYDIQAGIIRNLPIKSLIRFRLVSKQWKSLIDSSKFIAEYQTHQKHRHHLLVRFQSCYNKSVEEYFSIVDDDTFPQNKFSLTVPTSLSLVKGPDIVSSQGLLLVHRYDIYSGTRKALIWNPTIRKAVDIDLRRRSLDRGYFAFGFGVRPDTCDPMIVTFPYNLYEGAIFEVFTLSTNAWRRLSKNLPRERISFTKDQVAIDRFMYWFAHAYGNQSWYYSRNLIVSFDMTSEEFTEINLPDSLAVDQESIVKLSSIRESLIMVQFEADLLVSVWKMMELGVSKSFTKLYTINTSYGINEVHGFRKSGEPIVQMRDDPEKDLFAYDPDAEHINYIGISGTGQLFSVISYIETLLLLDH